MFTFKATNQCYWTEMYWWGCYVTSQSYVNFQLFTIMNRLLMPTISFFLFSTSSFLSRKLYHSNCGNDFFFHTHAYAKMMSGPFTLASWGPSDTVQMVAHLTVLWWHFTNLRTKKKLNVLNVMVAVSETYNENFNGDWNLSFFFKLSICVKEIACERNYKTSLLIKKFLNSEDEKVW